MSFLFYCGFAFVPVFTVLYFLMNRRSGKRAAFKRRENSEYSERGTQWNSSQHEYYVEKFYETGLTGEHDFHGGYLNFGYWVDGNTDYIKASEALLSQVADPVGLAKDSKLLDVANGSGSQDIYYYKKYSPKHIDMIDLALTHHLICKKRIKKHGLQEHLTAHYGSATNLPFDSSSFTHVFSVEGGIHYRTRMDFLKEAYRVLEPGGWISMVDYGINTPTNAIENFAGLVTAWLWNAPLENWYSCDGYKTALEEVGFVDVVVKDVGEQCIPGYYKESMRPETRAGLRKIRGWFATYVASRILDELVFYLYKKKLVTEVVVYGRKPSQQ